MTFVQLNAIHHKFKLLKYFTNLGTCGPLMKVLKTIFEQYYSVKVHLINEVGEGFLLQNWEDDVAVACYF